MNFWRNLIKTDVEIIIILINTQKYVKMLINWPIYSEITLNKNITQVKLTDHQNNSWYQA